MFLLYEDENAYTVLDGNQVLPFPKDSLSPQQARTIQLLPRAPASAAPKQYYQIPQANLPTAGEQVASGAARAVGLLGMAGGAGGAESAMPSASLGVPIVSQAAGGAAAASAMPAAASVTPGITNPSALAGLVASNQAAGSQRQPGVAAPIPEATVPGELDFSSMPATESRAALGGDITKELSRQPGIPAPDINAPVIGEVDFTTMPAPESKDAIGDYITKELSRQPSIAAPDINAPVIGEIDFTTMSAPESEEAIGDYITKELSKRGGTKVPIPNAPVIGELDFSLMSEAESKEQIGDFITEALAKEMLQKDTSVSAILQAEASTSPMEAVGLPPVRSFGEALINSSTVSPSDSPIDIALKAKFNEVARKMGIQAPPRGSGVAGKGSTRVAGTPGGGLYTPEQMDYMQRLDKAYVDAFRNRQNKINQASAKLAKIEDELNSKDLSSWSSIPTGRRMATAVMYALAAIGQGVAQRDPGQIVGMFANAMNQDLARQKEAVESKRESARSTYKRVLDAVENEQAADSMMRSMYLGQMERQVADFKFRTQRSDVRAAAERAEAMFNFQKKQHKFQTYKFYKQHQLNQEIHDLNKLKTLMSQEKTQKDLRVPGMELTGERTPTPKEAEKLTKERAVAVNTIKKLEDMHQYVHGPEGVGTELFPTRQAAKAKAMLTDVMLDLKELKNLGVLTGPDVDLLIAQLGQEDPTGFFSGQNKLLLENAIDLLKKGWAIRARQSGYRDIELGGTSQPTYVPKSATKL